MRETYLIQVLLPTSRPANREFSADESVHSLKSWIYDIYQENSGSFEGFQFSLIVILLYFSFASLNDGFLSAHKIRPKSKYYTIGTLQERPDYFTQGPKFSKENRQERISGWQ
jgi:hypothetical protein